jgi:predicted lipoprotein with Yx(FWY)xxD motif
MRTASLGENTRAPGGSPSAMTASRRRVGRSRRMLAMFPLATAFAFAACGVGAASKSSVPATAPTGSTAPANLTTPGSPTAAAGASNPVRFPRGRSGGTQIAVRSSQYGRILTGGADRTIYLFTHDRGTPSTCYGACAAAWPPVLTKGAPTPASTINALLLGTTRRRDGLLQATYGGHPLYYYASDPKGQILCQNVEEYGGTWLVVSPHGTPVR